MRTPLSVQAIEAALLVLGFALALILVMLVEGPEPPP